MVPAWGGRWGDKAGDLNFELDLQLECLANIAQSGGAHGGKEVLL